MLARWIAAQVRSGKSWFGAGIRLYESFPPEGVRTRKPAGPGSATLATYGEEIASPAGMAPPIVVPVRRAASLQPHLRARPAHSFSGSKQTAPAFIIAH